MTYLTSAASGLTLVQALCLNMSKDTHACVNLHCVCVTKLKVLRQQGNRDIGSCPPFQTLHVTYLITSSAVALKGKPFILTMPSPPKRKARAACISLRGTCRGATYTGVQLTAMLEWQIKCTEFC